MALGALAVPTAIKTALGLYQGVKSIFGGKRKRPVMGVPMAQQQATRIAEQSAQGVRPGSEQATENLKTATSDVVEGAQRVGQSSTDVLGTLSGAKAQESKGIRQNAVLDANYSQNARNQLMQQLGRTGQYQQQAFEFNKAQPYYEQEQARSALGGSAIQNLFGAGEEAGSLAILNNPKKYQELINLLGGM